MIFIKFIFLLFVLALAAIALIAYKFYKQLHRVVRRFQPEDNDFQCQQGFQDQQSSARTSRQADGNTIVDSRSEEQRAKKVIKDNEGEYIDYQ
jgi:hypothetical protein